MALFIENLNHKKVVDIDNLDKSEKEKIRDLMRMFTTIIEHYLFAKYKEEKAKILDMLYNYIYSLKLERPKPILRYHKWEIF